MQGCFEGCLRVVVAWGEAIGRVWMWVLGFSALAMVLALVWIVFVCWRLVNLAREDWDDELQLAVQAG